MRFSLGFKAGSAFAASLLSLAVISGCNDEGANTAAPPPSNPTPPPVAKPTEPPKKAEPATPPPPSTPKAEEKHTEKPAEKK